MALQQIHMAGGERRKRALAPERLVKTEVALRESVDGMTQAISEFERLGQLASALAHDTTDA